MLQRFNQITFLCPIVRTGGPEAIHQACLAFNKLGATASIIGRQDQNSLSRSESYIISSVKFPGVNSLGYGAYLPIYTDRHRIGEDTILILPEYRAASAVDMLGVNCAVWWLSVDNAFAADPRLSDRCFREKYFSNRNIIHLYQSRYAKDFLISQGVEMPLALSDYTDERFLINPLKESQSNNIIAYNPKKGGALAEDFFSKNTQFERMPLVGLSKDQLLEALRKAAIYIDFGHFPGKDRIPREAAAAGCIVFLNKAGAALIYDDFPVSSHFRFSAPDIASGELAKRVSSTIEKKDLFWSLQAQFRQDILWEKHRFTIEVMRLIGSSPPSF